MPPKARLNKNDKRHEAGLAAPGKRITKDKNSQPVNGNTHGRSTSTSTPPPVSPALIDHPGLPPRSDTNESSRDGKTAHAGHASKEQVAEAYQGEEQPTGVVMSRKLSIARSGHELVCPEKDASAFKSFTSQASSALGLTTTILSACPLRDAIAILILFLALPPVLITTIHALFMSLTFVSPAALLSWTTWTSFRSFGDWFAATPGGGPSPFTIVTADIMMFILYLICPQSLQGICIGLGQAVIAISLSGAAAGSESSTRSVLICSLMIIMTHLFKTGFFYSLAGHYLFPILHNIGLELGGQVDDFPLVSYSWPRALLGCHILAQGVLTLLRRWIANSNQKHHSTTLDAEQAILQSSGRLAMLNLENSEADARPPAVSTPVRDGKERMSGSKKKRKQANHVRSQQPLWAAIASTKITFMKELEHKQFSNDAQEVMGDKSAEDDAVYAVPMIDRVWIMDITSTKLEFRAELFGSLRPSTAADDVTPPSPGIDRQKPFFVRLNGADWGSTRITGAGDASDISQVDAVSWLGEVFGLSPLTKYTFEFVRMSDQHVIYSTNIITTPAPNTEQVISMPTQVQHQALRPMSPTSTLKQSIAAAEVKREELRNRLKRNRKDHKSAASAIRREVEQLQAKNNSSGSQDERSRQRILQLKQNIKQAEEATESLKQEIEALGEVPEEDVEFAAARRKSLDSASAAKDEALAALEQARLAVNKELAGLQAEISSAGQKHERLVVRRTKLSEQYSRMMSEQHADMSARQRHELERAQQREERNHTMEQLVYWINASRAQTEDNHVRANDFYRQAQQIEREMHLPPQTPEGNLPGTNGPRGPVGQPFEFPPISALSNAALPPSQWHGRQRSSSMLSGYSGFTNEIELSGGGDHGVAAGNGSGGSGSSEVSYNEPSQQPASWNPFGSTSPRPIKGTPPPGEIGGRFN